MNPNLFFLAVACLIWITAAISPAGAERLSLGLVILAGIPHGAFDLRIFEYRWGRLHWPLYVICLLYVAVGLSMSLFCLFLPAAGLAAFLAISVAHFSYGESSRGGKAASLITGSCAILVPAALHAKQSASYFAFFLGGLDMSQGLQFTQPVGLAAATLAAGAWIFEASQGRRSQILQWVVCLLSWIFLPPLSGFAVWFIGRHSRMHVESCLEALPPGSRQLGPDLAVLSVAAIAMLIPLATRFDFHDLNQTFAATIVLIAGLTLPHMIVTHNFAGSETG
jgi:Brp/Blh family beta-carotene 15,15'-monooxygenase